MPWVNKRYQTLCLRASESMLIIKKLSYNKSLMADTLFEHPKNMLRSFHHQSFALSHRQIILYKYVIRLSCQFDMQTTKEHVRQSPADITKSQHWNKSTATTKINKRNLHKKHQPIDRHNTHTTLPNVSVSWCSPFPPADTTLPNVSQFPGAHLSHQQTPPYQAFHSFLVLTFPTS